MGAASCILLEFSSGTCRAQANFNRSKICHLKKGSLGAPPPRVILVKNGYGLIKIRKEAGEQACYIWFLLILCDVYLNVIFRANSIVVFLRVANKVVNQILNLMNKITEVKSSTRAIRWLVFFVGLLGFSMNGSAQQEVSGTVTNAGGMALAGVTVSEKNSQNSVRTNELGYYSISLTAGNALVYSHVGYKALELNANQTGVLNATLQEDIAGLDEVVVVGYGTQKKGDLTSAVVSVKAKDFLSGNVRDAADLIRSKVAGLNITKGSGAPGDASQVTLRGLSTLQGSTAPLILIDGVVGDFSTVAPENIESIDVLKDASAAAIYGTRGANGVILITTKKGSRGETMAINYHTYAALSNFFKTPDFMDATDVRNGLTAYEDLGSDTDWLGEVTQRGITQNHSFNVQGGAANTTYSANVTLRNEKGVMKTTDLNSIKTTVDLTHFMLDDKLKININLVNSSQNSNITTASMADLRSPFRQAVIRNPTAPIYEADGTYAEDFNVFQYYNPVALLNERNGDNRNKWYRLTGNITAEPITGWKTNLMLSRRNSTVLEGFYDSQKFYTSIVEGLNGSANRSDYDFLSDNLELTTSYDRTFGGHSLNLLGGYSYLYNVSEGGSMFNFDFPTDVYSYHNISAGQALKDGRASVSSYKNNDRLVSFFARVNYSYKNKYSLMASVRREGSSKFGSNNKWGTFPAISAGWNVNQEEFLKDVSWLNNLKVRGGYGVTGVIPTSSYLSLTRYNYSTFYYDQGWKSGLDVVSNPNPDLKWEKSAELNIGLDFSLFSERFNGSFDFYNKNTKDMLWEYNVPLPPNRFSSTLANVGRMRNRGLELMLNVIPVKREHTVWSSMVTASHNTNQLV